MDDAARYPDRSALPPRLARLHELALDLWWSWNPAGRAVFRTLDYAIWRETVHNPIRMLRLISPQRFEEAASDPEFLTLYDRALIGLDAARSARDTWWVRRFAGQSDRPIAYFSAEFALHHSLPLYAGGLGVLAGDHCKESSDLGIPLIAVGFMYPQGYFHQVISPDGWQGEIYERLDWLEVPVEAVLTPDGERCVITMPLGSRTVHVAVWRVRVGRVAIYLLDTGIDANAPWDRELSARLYGGDTETRVQQEIILGIGGVRALRALGVNPHVWHLNEGHAAFVAFERIQEALSRGETFEAALEHVRETTVFTTHTPVPAGHDTFAFSLVEKHLANCWGSLGNHRDSFFRLGHYDSGGGAMFNMTALALRTAGRTNAVSKRHGEVTREMWAPIWPDKTPGEAPISTVTNGVHLLAWLADEMAALFDRFLPDDWRQRHEEPGVWDAVCSIPDAAIWEVRQRLKRYLLNFVRERTRRRWAQDRVSPANVVAAGALLDPDALTIGFARRFTGYKRPDLVFHDAERLARILRTMRRPVQIIFAGKAHPVDQIGKHLLQRVYKHAVDSEFAGRVAFIDDYDLHVAHYLVQGCDVWLNTPRKPLEASGTSGMKAALNGVPNLSVADGWWGEGYSGANGWVIEGRTESTRPEDIDAADAETLYRLLEEEIVPTFYTRESGLPTRWVSFIKDAIRTVAPRFSARRMVKQYAEHMYAPAAARHDVVQKGPH